MKMKQASAFRSYYDLNSDQHQYQLSHQTWDHTLIHHLSTSIHQLIQTSFFTVIENRTWSSEEQVIDSPCQDNDRKRLKRILQISAFYRVLRRYWLKFTGMSFLSRQENEMQRKHVMWKLHDIWARLSIQPHSVFKVSFTQRAIITSRRRQSNCWLTSQIRYYANLRKGRSKGATW